MSFEKCSRRSRPSPAAAAVVVVVVVVVPVVVHYPNLGERIKRKMKQKLGLRRD